MTLNDFTGQEGIKPTIRAEIAHAQTTQRPPRHIGLFGPPGIGKTTLAQIIAESSGCKFHKLTAGSEWTERKVQSFLLGLSHAGYDTKGKPGKVYDKHVIFIDEVHMLPKYEVWYKPMETFHLDHGAGATSWLPFFSLIGATTDPVRLPKPFRDRMPLQLVLKDYSVKELARIIEDKHLPLTMHQVFSIAHRSRGVARIALSYAQSVVIDKNFFDNMGIDSEGFTDLDRQYIALLEESPMSLSTLANRLGQTEEVLREMVEPYLLKTGRIAITGKGRQLTAPTGRGERQI